MLNRPIRFIAGLTIAYMDKDDKEQLISVRIEPFTLARGGVIGFSIDAISKAIKESGLRGNDFESAMEEVCAAFKSPVEDWCLTEPDYLVQYTGIVDKNDTPIYEGDVCTYGEESNKYGVVVFENGAFSLKVDTNCHVSLTDKNIVVVGNEEDNYELVEGLI